MTSIDLRLYDLRKLALRKRTHGKLERARPNPKTEVTEVVLWASRGGRGNIRTPLCSRSLYGNHGYSLISVRGSLPFHTTTFRITLQKRTLWSTLMAFLIAKSCTHSFPCPLSKDFSVSFQMTVLMEEKPPGYKAEAWHWPALPTHSAAVGRCHGLAPGFLTTKWKGYIKPLLPRLLDFIAKFYKESFLGKRFILPRKYTFKKSTYIYIYIHTYICVFTPRREKEQNCRVKLSPLN